jgi:hypothetical protein
VIDRDVLHTAPAVVGAAVQLQDIQALFQEVDEGQETVALQAAGVELVGRPVGRGDHHGAAGEEAFEEPAQDHGVGDVDHVELVEADQPGLIGQLAGQLRQGVGFLALGLGAPGVEPVVDLLHEGVEMHPALGLHRRAGEEQVHQHGLAPSDPAVEVKALGRLGPAAAAEAQALLPTALPGLGLVVADRVEQALQFFGGQLLGRVWLELTGPAQIPIGPERAFP